MGTFPPTLRPTPHRQGATRQGKLGEEASFESDGPVFDEGIYFPKISIWVPYGTYFDSYIPYIYIYIYI